MQVITFTIFLGPKRVQINDITHFNHINSKLAFNSADSPLLSYHIIQLTTLFDIYIQATYKGGPCCNRKISPLQLGGLELKLRKPLLLWGVRSRTSKAPQTPQQREPRALALFGLAFLPNFCSEARFSNHCFPFG